MARHGVIFAAFAILSTSPICRMAPAPVTRNDISTHAKSRLCALDPDTAALIVAFAQKREGPMELLELDLPSYGVSTPGIHIIDDDGERVCAGPFDPKSRPLPGLTAVSKTSSNTGGCKIQNALTGLPRRSSVMPRRHLATRLDAKCRRHERRDPAAGTWIYHMHRQRNRRLLVGC